MRGSAVRNYYNSNRSIVYIMVIAKIGNPIIPDTSDASRTQYEQLNHYPAVADRLYALYQRAQETAHLRRLAKAHGLQ